MEENTGRELQSMPSLPDFSELFYSSLQHKSQHFWRRINLLLHVAAVFIIKILLMISVISTCKLIWVIIFLISPNVNKSQEKTIPDLIFLKNTSVSRMSGNALYFEAYNTRNFDSLKNVYFAYFFLSKC